MYGKHRRSPSPPRPSAIRLSGHLRRSTTPDVVHSSNSPPGELAGSTSHSHDGESSRETFGLSSGHGGSLFHELRSRWEKPVATVVRFGSESESVHQPSVSGFGEMGTLNGNRNPGRNLATSGGKNLPHWPSVKTEEHSGYGRKISDSEMDSTTNMTHGEDEASNSSAPGSFHVDDGGYSEETPRKRKCLVCDDAASGYHYGVSSCEACKAFFKRTIQGNIEYACPASNTCVIDKRRRKACQACRYRKCLDVGMLKEGVRLDRVRGGRQKYRRAAGGDPIIVQTLSSHGPPRKPQTSPELQQLITSLVACEPENILSSITDRLDTRIKIQAVLCDLADRDLVGIIGWAKQIPGFPDLPLNDQMHLLQTTWCEIVLFSLCYRSIDALPHNLLFAEDFPVGEQMAREAGFDDVHVKACRLVETLSESRITREEYVVIKCIILLNGGCTLESVIARNTLRDTIVQSLHQLVNGTSRGSNLLLLLPYLRFLDGLAKQYWFKIKNEGNISMHKLFLEMLESAHQLM